jgi:aminotransferase
MREPASDAGARAAISRRVQRIKISATKEMPMIAARVGGCVSLGQGVPSFSPPEHVLEAVFAALRAEPSASKYSLQPGMPELRRAVAGQLLAEKGLASDPNSEIAIMVGAMEALLCAMLTLLDPGDEALVPEPYYPSHVEQIVLAEGTPVFVPLRAEDWGLDIEAMRRKVTARTKLIVVNSPHNPTGAVFDAADLRKLAEFALEHELYVICDDTYDYLTYDGRTAFSLASIPELRERLILVSSFSKRYALTGWRVGYVFAPAPLLAELLKVHDCATICAPTPAQHAALAALQGPQDAFVGFREALQRRRDLICDRLDALADSPAQISYVRPEGAFYVMARYDIPGLRSRDAAVRLIREAKVIAIPGGSFGASGASHLRLSFGGAEEELNEACDRMARWFEGLSSSDL